MNVGPAPAATPSTEFPNPPLASIPDGEDSATALPFPPTWGSSAPLAAPIASRPSSAPAQNGEEYSDTGNTNDGTSAMKDGPAMVPVANGVNHDMQDESSASSSSKGKSKAATVEDFIEDVD
jgi:hypothetical protein